MAKQETKPAKQTVATQDFINPFAKKHHDSVNSGAVAIEESRAVAEAMGKLYVAKNFPRDEEKAFEKIMIACSRKSMADSAQYSYPRGGEVINGPSIRLAEELARCWGNLDYGIRELSQKDGESEMEAYCWDLETNVISSQKFTVKHERTTKAKGTVSLTDQRDIYEHTANLGARRLRARILAILSPDLVDAAVDKCKQTLIGDIGDKAKIATRITKMLQEFKKFAVTEQLIEKRIGKKVTAILPEELGDLIAIYNSLKDGISKQSDWFETGQANTDASTDIGKLNTEIKNSTEPPLV